MEQGQNTISSGSGSAHGSPVTVDYKKLIAELKEKEQQEVDELGGVLCAGEVMELFDMSSTHARLVLKKLRKSGKVRALHRTVNGAKGWLYSTKDLYEIYKEHGCLSLG